MKKKVKKDGQTILCDVYSCTYCDCECKACSLSSIKVSLSSYDYEREATMCASYKER